jgi:hypothetical protein
MNSTAPASTRLALRRRLARRVAVISITLFVLLCAEWARSGYRSDLLWFSFGGSSEYSIRSDWGRLVFTAHHANGYASPARIGGSSTEGGYHGSYPGPPSTRVERLGIEMTRGAVIGSNGTMPSGTGTTYWRLRVYHPFVLLLLLLPTIPWAVQALGERCARRRTRAGLCSACGYNLRGCVSDNCPECGTPVPADFAQQPANTVVAAGAVD